MKPFEFPSLLALDRVPPQTTSHSFLDLFVCSQSFAKPLVKRQLAEDHLDRVQPDPGNRRLIASIDFSGRLTELRARVTAAFAAAALRFFFFAL
jgi:hypothetical protein